MVQRVTTLLALLFIVLFFAGCGGDNPSGPELQPGVISGKVSATDGRGGIDGVLLKVFAKDSVNQQTFSNEDGNFRFNRVDPGQYKVEITLPEGFKKSGPLQKTIQVDGGVSIDFKGEPITEQTKTILKGQKDTLFTGSGAFIAVDASKISSNIEVTIKEMDDGELANDNNIVTKPVQIWIRPPGAAKSSLNSAIYKAWSKSSSETSTKISLGQQVNNTTLFSNGAEYFLDVNSGDKPLRLYSKGDAKTYINTTTKREVDYYEHSFKSPQDANVNLSYGLSHYWDENCSNDLRKLTPLAGDKTGDKALIFIHGLQPQKGHCKDFQNFKAVDLNDDDMDETFDYLITKLRNPKNGKYIDNHYKFYTYRYPTNTHIIPDANELWNLIKEKNIKDPVLLAHSMGGLVGRVLIQNHPDDFAGLITLSTPHEGTSAANLATLISKTNQPVICTETPFLCPAVTINGNLLPDTPGLQDLRPGSELISSLENVKGDPRKIFTIGGVLQDVRNVGDHGLYSGVYKIAYEYLKKLKGKKSDGLVPISSSTPVWSGLQTVLAGHDHDEMSTGNLIGTTPSNSVSDQVTPILQELYSCEPAPKRLTSNDFNISGSIARVGGKKVQVTLNAITIDGKVVKNLSSSNITLIENGCVRNTSKIETHNVGVDIAFVQDMSNSMDDAISGVRSSVISFTNTLANRGINAKIGSIGYSGPGKITTEFINSPCEDLGPYQDLTDPVTFKNHVANKWYAYGGCDKPENALEAIKYAHNHISWRDGAARAYIDITDVSHHTKNTNCNDTGPCTNQTLSSITNLVKEKATIHAVASQNKSYRTADGGLDPWKLASNTGGKQLVLPYNGYVNLTKIGIADVIGKAFKFTFQSGSPQKAHHTIRIRVEINGKVAELAPALVKYKILDSTLEDFNN